MKSDEQRPPVWIGHVVLETNSIEQSAQFMRLIGMRPIASGEDFAVLELRGGTHLVLIAKDDVIPGEVPFDLMVDDLVAIHQKFEDLGMAPAPIEEGNIHSSFKIKDPVGHEFKFNSSHVGKLPV
jgi:hypothetical protein